MSTKWFYKVLLRWWKVYGEVVLAAFFINLFALCTSLFVMNVYDRVVPNSALSTLWVLTIGVLIVFVFDITLRALRGYLLDVVGRNVDVTLSDMLFNKVLGMRLENRPTSVGSFVSQFREFDSLRDFITSATLTTIIDIPFLVLFLILIAYLGGVVALVPLAIIPIVITVATIIERPLQAIVKEGIKANAHKNSVLTESLTSLETVKALNIENTISDRFTAQAIAAADHNLKSRFLSAQVINFTYVCQQLATVFMVVVGVYAIILGSLTTGGLIACTILGSRALAPLGQIANLLTRYEQAKAALVSLSSIVELPQDKAGSKQYLHINNLKGELEFNNVTFAYPGQPSSALRQVSFKVNSGERVAILGKIGSGKTTINKLLLNLYSPQDGNIYIDGIDAATMDTKDLRQHIGYVPQDSRLFAGSIKDNILLGKPDATDDEILHVGKLCGIEAFLSRTRAGYDLPVGERGENLSGGQRQAVAIARALISNPSLLLLDEFTSAMDGETQGQLLANITPLFANKTVVIVTHNLALVELVNRVIYIENGKVVFDNSSKLFLEKVAQSQVKKTVGGN